MIVLTGLLAAACAESGGESAGVSSGDTERQAPPTIENVVVRTETFVDTTRPTDPPLGTPDRTIETTIYTPDAGGPYPLVVFSHGFNGHPRKFTELADAWARAGYVVAVPKFPITNDELLGQTVIGDYHNQPADVRFVIDELLVLAARDADPLHERLDPDRIGAAGLSLGAVTTLAVTFNTCCRDPRIDATISMAGARLPYDDGEYELVDVPLLLLHSEADPAIPHSGSAAAYVDAEPPKFFVSIVGNSHAPPFEDADHPADAMVTAVTIDFWNLYLAGRAGVLDQLVTDASVPGLSTLQYEAA